MCLNAYTDRYLAFQQPGLGQGGLRPSASEWWHPREFARRGARSWCRTAFPSAVSSDRKTDFLENVRTLNVGVRAQHLTIRLCDGCRTGRRTISLPKGLRLLPTLLSVLTYALLPGAW